MKAWRVHAWGEPESMRWEEVEAPEPGPGQLLIRTRAAGLNFFDILQIQGKYQVRPPFPFIPGAEVAGVVEAVGAGVGAESPTTGDSVIGLTYQGGMAEYVAADAKRCFRVPTGMSFAEAATFPIVFQTSYFALKDRAALAPGEWLLVHAGASGTGTSAIQIGKAFGATVIATAGSAAKLEFCLAQGADFAIDYSDARWVDEVKRITGGHGADVIYDPVGGDVFDLSTKCIASGGRLLVIGFASGRIPTVAANRILLKNISIVGAVWGGYAQNHPEYPGQAQAALAELYRLGKIRPPTPVLYPLSSAPQALKDLAERRISGKAALLPD